MDDIIVSEEYKGLDEATLKDTQNINTLHFICVCV